MKKIKTLIQLFLFGRPIQGEPIGQPTFKTVMPPNFEHIDFFEWAQYNRISTNLNK